MIFAFQPFSIKILNLSAQNISLLYTLFGALNLITQLFLLQKISKVFGLKRTLSVAFLVISSVFLLIFFIRNPFHFVIILVFLGLANSLIMPINQTVLSRETDEKSQGSIMGLNASYMSIGQIAGPVIGGAIATISIPFPFLAASLFSLLCFFLSFQVLKKGVKKESAFWIFC